MQLFYTSSYIKTIAMKVFADLLGNEETIFKNERSLMPEYIPDNFPHREHQIQAIATCLKPALKGKRAYNVFIYGPPGTGKTAITKFLFNEMVEASSEVIPIYVNCWEYNTRHAILCKILSELKGFVPRRGIATDEIFERFLKVLEKREKSIVIALDEIDQVVNKKEYAVLYDILRANEWVNANLSLITISNDAFVMRYVDARIKSSLCEEEIIFKPYTEQELRDIIKERVKIAFYPGVVSDEVIDEIARITAEQGGDVRIALECLWKAGRLAERQASRKIELKHIEEVAKKLGDYQIKELLRALTHHEKILLKVIAKMQIEGKEILTGTLYEEYKKNCEEPVAERTFRNYISRLETLRLIDAPLTSKGYRGKSRKIELRLQPEIVLEALKEYGGT